MKTEQSLSNSMVGLKSFTTIACVLSGCLAGGNIDRYIVQVPAWQQLNILNWAQYSRVADLGNGIYLYPFEAIGAALMLIAASVIIFTDKHLQSVSLPVYLATFFALIGLGFTALAAPIMLSLRGIGNNPDLLQNAFDHFQRWGLYRGIAQVLSFGFCVRALGKVYGIKMGGMQ